MADTPLTTRRAMLRALPALTVTAAPAIAIAAEEPHAKVRRLTRELSEALNDTNDGREMAMVYPSRHPQNGTGWADIASWQERWTECVNAKRYFDMLDRLTPFERAKHHAQKFTLAFREYHGFADIMEHWIGDRGFVVCLDHRVPSSAEREAA